MKMKNIKKLLSSDLKTIHNDVDDMLYALPVITPIHPNRVRLYQTKCRLEYWIMKLNIKK